jgi:hypothetical protein
MKREAKSRRLAASALVVCVWRERKWSGPHVSVWETGSLGACRPRAREQPVKCNIIIAPYVSDDPSE